MPPATVRVYVHAILQKLDVRDRTQAAVIAVQTHFINQQLLSHPGL
nr:LuxR C-terminal-related transcriptional regulator [Leptolyngbya sp. FACHB-321]